tara:strand:- start:523 stop:657 length:135 start_codon:yes stop_codon:yes gene_type:complete
LICNQAFIVVTNFIAFGESLLSVLALEAIFLHVAAKRRKTSTDT